MDEYHNSEAVRGTTDIKITNIDSNNDLLRIYMQVYTIKIIMYAR